MKLSQLTAALPGSKIIGNADVEITDICIDSRKVAEGAAFVCIPGTRVDRHAFAPQAVAQGAVALIVERPLENVSATQVVVEDSRRALALMAGAFYGYPSGKLKIIGVTGTNGKTTITNMVRAILKTAGIKTGLIGTVASYVGEKMQAATLTTPDPMELNSLLAQMVEEGCEAVVMEASAHALELRKLAGVQLQCGVFTNLTQDHLDDFKTMENYSNAKRKLFTVCRPKFAVINADDEASRFMVDGYDGLVISYGIENRSGIYADNISVTVNGSQYTLHAGGLTANISLKMPGYFNIYNSMAAACVCLQMGISLAIVEQGLREMPQVDGRIERVETGKDFSVIVDYAHSPDSLHNILSAVRLFTPGKVIAVFGCGGDRDRGKRPIMGRIGVDEADFAVITSDNPRTEEPDSIIDMVVAGIPAEALNYCRITDRRQAIAHALSMAGKGDVVVIAGKGHETYQDIMGVKHHFDDREVVRELLGC